MNEGITTVFVEQPLALPGSDIPIMEQQANLIVKLINELRRCFALVC